VPPTKVQAKTPVVLRRQDLPLTAFELERLRLWLDENRKCSGLSETDFYERLATFATWHPGRPDQPMPDEIHRWVRSKLGPRKDAAAIIGAALRALQSDGKTPMRRSASLVHSLLAGGYYIDLVGTFGHALRGLASASTCGVALRYAHPLCLMHTDAPGLDPDHTTVGLVPDYEALLFGQMFSPNPWLYIEDEMPFRAAYEAWTPNRDLRELPPYFDVAIYCFVAHDVMRGLELFTFALKTRLAWHEVGGDIDVCPTCLQPREEREPPPEGGNVLDPALERLHGPHGRPLKARSEE
jgi:hypothetical protein